MNRMISTEQVLEMKNKGQRQGFLKTWEEWPMLVEAKELAMQVREVVFPDGSRFTATLFGDDPQKKQLGLQKRSEEYMPYSTADGQLIDHLTQMRKEFATLSAEEIRTKYPPVSEQIPTEPDVVLGKEARTLTKDEIMALKNPQLREDFIRAYEEWPFLIEVPILHMKVRKLGLPDGCSICATTFSGFYSVHYRLLKEGEAYNAANDFTTRINDHLRTLGADYRYQRSLAKIRNDKK